MSATMEQSPEPVHVVNRQRRIPVKPSQADIEERVNYCIDMLCDGKKDGEIIRATKERFDVSSRTVARYLSLAREKLVDESKESRAGHRLKRLEWYYAVVDNVEVPWRDRIRAAERIDKLLGLEIHESSSKRVVEVSGPNGAPIQSVNVQVGVDLGGKLGEFANAIRAAAMSNILESAQIVTESTPAITDNSSPVTIPVTVDARQEQCDKDSK